MSCWKALPFIVLELFQAKVGQLWLKNAIQMPFSTRPTLKDHRDVSIFDCHPYILLVSERNLCPYQCTCIELFNTSWDPGLAISLHILSTHRLVISIFSLFYGLCGKRQQKGLMCLSMHQNAHR